MNRVQALPHLSDTPASLRLERILIVGDADDFKPVAKISLEQGGEFDARACASGADAVRQADAYRPDLLRPDVMMRGLDGLDTLAGLRDLPALVSMPVAKAAFLSTVRRCCRCHRARRKFQDDRRCIPQSPLVCRDGSAIEGFCDQPSDSTRIARKIP